MADFTVMKGFLSDFAVKGGEAAETLPPDPGHDVMEDEEELDDKTEGKEGPKGGLKTSDDDLTMEKDLSTVDEGAKRDVKDGYTEDIQDEEISGEEEKGFEAYNRMVSKGLAVEEEHLNKWNVGQMVDDIEQQASEMVAKELSDSLMVTKGKGGFVAGFNKAKKDVESPARLRRAWGAVKRHKKKAIVGTAAAAGGAGGGLYYNKKRKSGKKKKGMEGSLVVKEMDDSMMVEKGERWNATKAGAQGIWDAVKAPDRGKRAWASLGKTKDEAKAAVDRNWEGIKKRKKRVIGGAALTAGTSGSFGYYAGNRKHKEMEDPSIVEKGNRWDMLKEATGLSTGKLIGAGLGAAAVPAAAVGAAAAGSYGHGRMSEKGRIAARNAAKARDAKAKKKKKG